MAMSTVTRMLTAYITRVQVKVCGLAVMESIIKPLDSSKKGTTQRYNNNKHEF